MYLCRRKNNSGRKKQPPNMFQYVTKPSKYDPAMAKTVDNKNK